MRFSTCDEDCVGAVAPRLTSGSKTNPFVHWAQAGVAQDVEAARFDPKAANVSIAGKLFTGTEFARCYGVRVTAPGGEANGVIAANEFAGALLHANGVPASDNVFR